MAIDFNGTTSKIEHTTATGFDLATFTICAWVFIDAGGGGGLGRIFQCDETSNSLNVSGWGLYHADASGFLRFGHSWSGASPAAWDFAASHSAWHPVSVSYDRGNIANDPVCRVDFADVTPSEAVAPSGSAVGPAAGGYCIGNRTGQDRGWNGMIEHLQIFSGIMPTNERDACLLWPGSVWRNIVAWWPLLHNSFLAQMVGGGPAAGTATALNTYRSSAPCAMPWNDTFDDEYALVAAPAAAAPGTLNMPRRKTWWSVTA